jgi:hypothetical protein
MQVVDNSNKSPKASEQPLEDKTNEMNFMSMSTNMNISPMPSMFYPGMNMNMMWFYQNNQGNM